MALTLSAFVAEILDPKADSRTQIIMVQSEDRTVIYRRMLAPGQSRTHWKPASVANGPGWITNIVNMSKTVNGADPTFSAVIELTEDEKAEAVTGTLPRNVGLRFDRARKHALAL